MKSCLVKRELDFPPFNLMSPPFSESMKKQVIDGLKFAGTSQNDVYVLMVRVFTVMSILAIYLSFSSEIKFFVGHVADGSIFRP